MLNDQVRWGKIGGQQASESILALLSKGGWYLSHEIEERFTQTPWIVLDQLIALQANDRLVSIRIPERRQFLWHKATRQLTKATETNSDASIRGLPWRARKEVAKKLKGRHPGFKPAGASTNWMRAAKRAERHMTRAGLESIRARPDLGLDYKCAWHMETVTGTYLPGNRESCFQIGFVGASKARLHPPSPVGRDYMRVSESTGWLGSGDCQYLVITDRLGTRLWLSCVAQLTVDFAGQVTTPSPEEFAERTSLMVLEGAGRLPALVTFTQMFSPRIQLLSKRKSASAETKPS